MRALRRRELEERGFLRLGSVLTPADLARLHAAIAPLEASQASPNPYGTIVPELSRRVQACDAIVRRGALANLACELLAESEVLLFQDLLVSKTPGTTREVRWHQDYSYWPLDEPAGVTFWIALDAADAANGCLRYIPGTHRHGERRAADFVEGAHQPRSMELQALDAEARAREAVDVAAGAGELLAHHPLVWHMSGPNLSERPRRAWTMTWVLPRVRWAPAHAPHPYLYTLAPSPGAPLADGAFPRFLAPPRRD